MKMKIRDFFSDPAEEEKEITMNVVTLYETMLVMITLLFIALVFASRMNGMNEKDNICISADCVNSSEYFLDIINNSVNPCDNFYEFACGGYAGPTSTLEEAQNRVLEELKSFTTGKIRRNDSKAVKTQKKYYQTCMNTSAIEEDDNRSFKRLIEELGGWPILMFKWVNNYNLEKITEKCVNLGLAYDWFVDVDTEAHVNHESRTLKISPPSNINISKEFKDNYQLLIENIVKRLRTNNSLDLISEAAKEIVEFEFSLSQVITESSGLSATTVEKLVKDFPSLPWQALLKHVVIEKNATVKAALTYFPKLVRFLERTNLRTKVNYIFWKLTQSIYEFLPRDIRREFEDYDEVINKKTLRNRSDFCYEITQTMFAYVSEAAYAQRYQSETESIKIITKNIKSVMQDHINASKWMNTTHKEYAFEKLRNLTMYIGGPEEVFDDEIFNDLLGVDEVDILNRNNTLNIVRAVDKSRDKYNLNLRRRRISYLRARLYLGIVNIQATKYLPTENLIYIPAAVVGGLFNFQKGLHFRNYSVLGTIIAHEMAHGFGILDSFVQTNKTDEMRWSNETFQTFLNDSKCLLEQCEELKTMGTKNDVRGKTTCQETFDENFADYTSVNLAYEAFQRIKKEEINQLPGLKYTLNQLFWLSYASTMCDSMNNSTQGINFKHQEPYLRIIGSYRNSEHFGEDFNCREGSFMNPVDKCVVL